MHFRADVRFAREFSGCLAAFARATIGVLYKVLLSTVVVGSLLSFGARPLWADTTQTFSVSTTWLPGGGLGSSFPNPDPIDATSTIVMDTTTGQVTSSHVTGGGITLPLKSQQSGTGTVLLTFFGGATDILGDNITITLNLYLPVSSLAGYGGGVICDASNPCSAGNSNEVVTCTGSGCTSTTQGNFGANTGQLILVPPNGVPFLNSLSPWSTPPGGSALTLTILGAGFAPGAVAKWDAGFGPLPLTTTVVSSDQLTAAVPATDIATAGTAAVTVTNPSGHTSNALHFQASNSLTPTNFTVFANNEIDVYKNRTSNTLAGVFSLGRGGHLDVAAYANGVIYVLLGNGNGTFAGWQASPGPPPPPAGASDPNTYLAAADINGDGILDLVIMNSNGIFIALGNGDRTFRLLSTSLSDVVYQGHITIADFNGDGFLDLAYSTTPYTVPPVPTAIQVQLGNGDGTFRTGPATVLPLANPNGPTQFLLGALAAGDFNGDGKLDLMVAAANPSGCQGQNYWLFEYPGNGDGSFGTPSTVPGSSNCGGSIGSAVVGDFNDDGKLDVSFFRSASGLGTNGVLSIDLGNGDGTFRTPYQYAPSPALNMLSGPVLAGDFNGDGKLDLMAGSQLLYGNGDGSVTPNGPIVNGLQVVQVGDFNGDGKVDLLALGTNPSNSSQFDLRLLTQIPAPPDFGGGITPSTQTAGPGGSANYSGSVVALNGFTGNVALSASGMPTGVTASFNPGTVTGGSGSYTMTVSVASSVAIGTYNFTVTGTSGSLVHSSTVTLIVNSSPGDFSSTLTGSDSMQNIVAGQTATYNIQISPIGGFNGNVALSVSGVGYFGGRTLPGTATFNPSTVTGGSGTSTLTVTTTNPIPFPDVYVLTITATSGPLVHTGVVYLGIGNSAGDFTGSITPNSQTISVGQVATYTANITYLNGFSPNGAFCVNLSVNGLPPGAQFNLVSRTGCYPTTGETDTFTISAPPGTPTGTYNMLLVGNGGDRIRARAFSLTIQ